MPEMTAEDLDLFANNWPDPDAIKKMGAPYDWNFVLGAMSGWWVTLSPETNAMLGRVFEKFRRFELVRERDVSGVSGTGIVAEGVQFSTGKCVLAWRTQYKSIAIYDDMADLLAIHGHDGATKLKWLEGMI